MNIQAPLVVHYLVGVEDLIEDGHHYLEVDEEAFVEGEVEQVTAHSIKRHIGEDIFKDVPKPIEVQQHLSSGCSGFG